MKRYLLLFFIATAVAVAALMPLHSLPSGDLALLTRFLGSGGKTVMFGNSVVAAYSKCDADRRSLAELATGGGRPALLNVATGGMTLGDMLYIAELGTVAGARPETIIFPLSPEAGYFRTTNTEQGLDTYISRNIPALSRLAGRVEHVEAAPPQDYLGNHYGNYNEFSKIYFVREKASATCPEQRGVSPAFEEFMYWRNFLQGQDPLQGYAQFAQRIKRIEQRHIRVLVWLMPVNFGELEDLHASASARVRTDIAHVRQALQQAGVTVLDGSEGFAPTDFTDRWCACGHMAEHGRKLAAAQLSQVLSNERHVDSALHPAAQ